VATYDDLVTAGIEERAIFRGAAGTYTWSTVEFPGDLAIVRWDVTGGASRCEVSWSVGSSFGAKILAGAGERVTGSRQYSTSIADSAVSVRSSCGKFLVTIQGRDRPTPQPVSGGGGSGCHPSYRPCLPIVGDLDCPDVRRMGKAPVRVVGYDAYRLDRDNDGVGCE
jgi:hypothetical protein